MCPARPLLPLSHGAQVLLLPAAASLCGGTAARQRSEGNRRSRAVLRNSLPCAVNKPGPLTGRWLLGLRVPC